MSELVLTFYPKNKVKLKGVALPNEHGAWGFLFEPLVASFAVLPFISSLWIALLVIGAFLIRQPLKVVLINWQSKNRLPQATLATNSLILYEIIFLIGLFGCLFFVNPISFIPFLVVSPFAVYQIYCDYSRQSRQLLPELTGAIAISSSAAVMALAGGWSVSSSLALWGIFIARLIPSILYIRNRLRLEKGKKIAINPVVFSNLIALGGITYLASAGLIPKLTIPIFVFLAVRAVWGLSPLRKKVKAMRIGIWEVIFGVLTVLSVILGYYFQL